MCDRSQPLEAGNYTGVTLYLESRYRGVALRWGEGMIVAMSLGRALRAARGARTQTEIAELLGVGQNTVSDWERDRSVPPLEHITALELAAGRPRGWALRLAGHVDDVVDVRSAIAADPELDDIGRELVLDVYEIRVERVKGSR